MHLYNAFTAVFSATRQNQKEQSGNALKRYILLECADFMHNLAGGQAETADRQQAVQAVVIIAFAMTACYA